MDKLIIGNWKMRPTTRGEAEALARASDAAGVVVAPPFPFLDVASRIITRAALAVQNVFSEDPEGGGAYTGEVSCAMARAMGARYAIIGHSERREYLRESDAMIAKKVSAAIAAGLTPVLCVGEKKEVRDKGSDAARVFVETQLLADLTLIRGSAEVIVAYEPVWAIGTGDNATPEVASAMSEMIRTTVAKNFPALNIRVLYGGSVSEENIASFAAERRIDGFLVGGASAKAAEFAKMITTVRELQ